MNQERNSIFASELSSSLLNDIGVAIWIWDLVTDQLYYNDMFYEMTGYEPGYFIGGYETWDALVHPDDRAFALKSLSDFKDGISSSYNIELRLVNKSGEVFWLHDKGNFTKFDKDGKAIQISGAMRDITKRKKLEKLLSNEEEKLRLSMKFAGFTSWEWNIKENAIIYDKDYAESLGYCSGICGTCSEQWATIIHPDDLNVVKENISSYLTGELESYNFKLRIKKGNGEYFWVRDIGEIVERDENGYPTRVVGGRIDINNIELANEKIAKYHENLEAEINQRNQDILRQDTILFEINEISQKLMTIPPGKDFEKLAYGHLQDFKTVTQNERLSIFRYKTIDDKLYCYLASSNHRNFRTEFSLDEVIETFEDVSAIFATGGAFVDGDREAFYNYIINGMRDVDFEKVDVNRLLPKILEYSLQNKVLNVLSKDLSSREFIFTTLQGIKSVMMAPMYVSGELWGFILLDRTSEVPYPKDEEKLLTLVGNVFAQAVHKNELELIAKQAVEYNNLIINSMPLCCNVWLDGKNIQSNDEAARLFELSSKEEYLERFFDLNPETQPNGRNSAEAVAEKLATATEFGYAQFEWMHQKLDGEPMPCEVTLVKVPYGDRHIIIGYTRDLRDSISKQKALVQAHEEALLSSKAKSNFLANMSHEIRTPMNAISGMTDIIIRDTTEHEISDYAQNIKRACDTLLGIINDVLDISKIESGKLEIVEAEYSLSALLQDVLAIATNRLESKPLMFISNFQQDLPDNLMGDEVRVKQIMVNILNNAIKFTPNGHISFELSGEYAESMLKLQFSIIDTGIGISSDDLEKLFIEFERVNTTKNRSIEGTGLGLAISKQLCEMMNGYIEIESEVDKGTKFSVTIYQEYVDDAPIAKLEKQRSVLIFESRDLYRDSLEYDLKQLGVETVVGCGLQSELNEALNEQKFDFIFTSSMFLLKVQETLLKMNLSSKIVLLADNSDIKSKYDYATILIPTNVISVANVLNGKTNLGEDSENFVHFIAPDCKILIVDDNLVNLKVAQGLMKPYEFSIDTAENGEEAVSKIKWNKYDLVFMDHMMPIMDGIDATIAVRAFEDEYFKNLPIVALTANAIIGTREMFLSEGMNDFLAKPIKLQSLNDILHKWLPIDKQIAVNLDDIDKNDEQNSLVIPNIDTKLGIKRVGGQFDSYIDILNMYYKDGVRRIPQIRNFFDSKQLLNFKIEVHALKSASASIGAIDISEKARLLEESAYKEDWVYINQNTIEFIDDFNILLEHIRETLKGMSKETDNTDKPIGNLEFFNSNLIKLKDSLDYVDIKTCETLLLELENFTWDEKNLENLQKIKDFLAGYEYDEATEFIEEILS